mmetsp:Transcript_4320/g.11850  ORF Transcript_4320/g.11850 Transcript_4320/m.11850 type:complete len:164 (+) Transcript_4320:17-508(+)
MANAAAKKAAAARSQASGTYLPILAVANVVWALLRFAWYSSHTFHWPEGLAVLSLAGVQYYAYTNILDQAATSKSNKKQLTGGVFLDVLGLALLLQYCAVLIWKGCYWGTFIFPVWGAYSLYSTFAGGSNQTATTPSAQSAAGEDEYMNRKQKRAATKEKMKR